MAPCVLFIDHLDALTLALTLTPTLTLTLALTLTRCVLFIDHLDALAPPRGHDTSTEQTLDRCVVGSRY